MKSDEMVQGTVPIYDFDGLTLKEIAEKFKSDGVPEDAVLELSCGEECYSEFKFMRKETKKDIKERTYTKEILENRDRAEYERLKEKFDEN